MGRNNGSQVKWGIYALSYLVMYFIKICILNRIPIYGALPELAPLVVAAVGCYEGSLGGALYGLGVGFFCSAVYFRGGTMMIPICTVTGVLAGLTTRRQIGKNFLGVVLCGAMGVLVLEGARVFYYYTFGGNDMETLLRIAVPEGLYSLVFVIPIYFVYAAIYQRYRTDTEL
ncbi:MAG: rod shape-determining protein MreD [Clostridiales bacterium]|nr:rod shape-determining protein MreD [Clostridiales bacterium]